MIGSLSYAGNCSDVDTFGPENGDALWSEAFSSMVGYLHPSIILFYGILSNRQFLMTFNSEMGKKMTERWLWSTTKASINNLMSCLELRFTYLYIKVLTVK